MSLAVLLVAQAAATFGMLGEALDLRAGTLGVEGAQAVFSGGTTSNRLMFTLRMPI